MATIAMRSDNMIVVRYPVHFHKYVLEQAKDTQLHAEIQYADKIEHEYFTRWGRKITSHTHYEVIVTNEWLSEFLKLFNSIEGTNNMIKVNRNAVIKLLEARKKEVGDLSSPTS